MLVAQAVELVVGRSGASFEPFCLRLGGALAVIFWLCQELLRVKGKWLDNLDEEVPTFGIENQIRYPVTRRSTLLSVLFVLSRETTPRKYVLR
jgi:hypothetical protein